MKNSIDTLLKLRTKLVKQLMSIPYDAIDKAQIDKMKILTSDINSVNLKIKEKK